MSDNQSLGAAYYVKHITVLSVFSGLAAVAVVLRFWARRIQKMSLELNDYLIVPGLVCALGETAVNIYGCCFGTAKEMSQEDIMKAIIFSQKSQFMCPIIWVASVTFIRASIVFLYIRIFPTRFFRIVCYLVLAVNLCFFVGTILADCLICQPISYRWDRTVGGTGSCGDQKSLDLFIGIFNLFLDVTAVVLPMPVLWGLKMAVGKKMMLSGMFGMGTAICAITLYRIYDTSTIAVSNAQEAYAVIAMLTSLEALLGVINACLPVLKPIFNKMRGTAPKRGDRSGVSEILKSGTIPIFIRVSQMWTLTSRRGKTSSSDATLTETSGWYGEKGNGKSGPEGGKGASVTTKEISPPITQKADRVLGITTQAIHVRRDVDVESVASRDERGLVCEGWEGRQERW
ncbi:hypothetical protein HO173_009519 [Letharia columbiana]|uniref:Rhodopsin domain-containing protein n=1 Tax=Letharia columbiana TaxID=112416 RepID=A0A8H6L1V0_9LECA|nr:uncharacterized protein HO173_009519 [Letharia columbiana]KAF6232414.1 hypothetical protein HO173_009519 [Letharia columbiana]